MENTEAADQTFKLLKDQDSANNLCFECQTPSPSWASVNNGIYLCLQCAGVHRGLGVQTSFVRSLNLDDWPEDKLALMKCGGNTRLISHFAGYDLNDLPVANKYGTVAADFYRRWLKCISTGAQFSEEAPSYEEGRQMLPGYQQKNYDIEGQPDNITLVEGQNQGSLQQSDYQHYADQAAGALRSGWSYLQWGASQAKAKANESGLTEKMKNAATTIDQKAEETGFKAGMSTLGAQVKSAANKAANYTYESGQSIYTSAQDGTLGEKSKEKASNAGKALESMGSSLMNRWNAYRTGQAQPEQQPQQEPQQQPGALDEEFADPYAQPKMR